MKTLAFLAALTFAGCATTSQLETVTSSAAIALSGGYRLLDAYDIKMQHDVVAKAEAGDPEGAQADIEAYLPKWSAAHLALSSCQATVQLVYDSIPVVAKDRDKSAQSIAKIAAMYADVVNALAALGIKLPTLPGGL